MKMKTSTRVIFTVYLVAVIALCVFVLGIIFKFVSADHIANFIYTINNGAIGFKILYIAISIVVIAISCILMFFGIKKDSPKTAKIAVFESGSIVITIKAIEEMVERYVRENKNVKGLRTVVVSYDSYVEIDIEVSVLPEVDIPEITKELQAGLIAYIQTHTGIDVKQTKISIMGLNDSKIKAQ
ncbi:MAG: alkaline shock response membrane anchor protein AmaP [Christensenellaceae bacterium]